MVDFGRKERTNNYANFVFKSPQSLCPSVSPPIPFHSYECQLGSVQLCVPQEMLRTEMEELGEEENTWKYGKGCEVEGAQTAFAKFKEYQSHVT